MGINIDMKGVYDKLSQSNLTAGRVALSNQAYSDMNENFVPFKDGGLRGMSGISKNGEQLFWNSVYARKHFYNDFSPNYSTPGTGPHWDDKASNVFMSDWIKAYVKGADLE
ncbi:hypothetical protein BG261_05365 [Floricoccus tropicus]|uniref:Minor capsid protein n=1 Tax=Floricoccus tropicus TaxID=1859473 RepID=A0A1E8GKR0_9LACT|nr:minor capsid protein [Floricoccus tropicus]OFI48819.1 hypothetical protein BG261_05365 [Floricoccus tropicus]